MTPFEIIEDKLSILVKCGSVDKPGQVTFGLLAHCCLCLIAAMIATLQKSESDQSCRQLLMKASERLGKVLSETDIRLFVDSMVHKNKVDRYVSSLGYLRM